MKPVTVKWLINATVKLALGVLGQALLSLAYDPCRDMCTRGHYCDIYLGICEPCRFCVNDAHGCSRTCDQFKSTTEQPKITTTTSQPIRSEASTNATTTDRDLSSTGSTAEAKVAAAITPKDIPSNVSISEANYESWEWALFFGLLFALVFFAILGYFAIFKDFRQRLIAALKCRQDVHDEENIELEERVPAGRNDRKIAPQNNVGHRPIGSWHQQPNERIGAMHPIPAALPRKPGPHGKGDYLPVPESGTDGNNIERPGPSRNIPELEASASRGRDSGYSGSLIARPVLPVEQELPSVSSEPLSHPRDLRSLEDPCQTAQVIDHRREQQQLLQASPLNDQGHKALGTHTTVQDGTHLGHEITTGTGPFTPHGGHGDKISAGD